jgi:hypothetical protein
VSKALLRLHGNDLTVGIKLDGLHLEAAQPCGVVRGHAVVVEQIPAAFILNDAVVGGPSYDGIENDALIGERSVGIVTNGIAEEVAVARGVGEKILAVVFECLQ